MKMLSIAAAAVLVAAAAHAQIREADVTGGKVSGVVANGLSVFKGIPFAAPPVGERRWKAPQPLAPWTGVRDGSTFGPACVQDPMFPRVFAGPTELNEDCLYLNVWTPAKAAGDKLPVMVWIYGGGFVGGQTSAPIYDGAKLVEKGVIVVSVAYPFGFLAHPELSRESGKGSGNFGLQDQIAGLQWVKANIAKFGGDSARVTIFGESAGGMSVSMLAASPAAKGLFQRAISESGGSFGGARTANEGGVNVPPLKVAEANGQKYLEKLGVSNIAGARAVGADKIMAAQGLGMSAAAAFWPVFDGDVLPGDQYELYQAQKFNDTPVLIGTNSDEGALFIQGKVPPAAFEQTVRSGFGKGAETILQAYPHATEADASAAARNLMRESTFAWHTWAWAMLQSEKGKGKAFVYYYDHRTPQQPNGASHGAEIPYVFRTLGAPGANLGGPVAAPRPEDLKMSELMSSYWTNFAKTGNPNGPGLPVWPEFSVKDQRVMFLDDTQSGARPVPNIEQLKALESYYAWRRSEGKGGLVR
jgi:para-nitrobenzyl esterase